MHLYFFSLTSVWAWILSVYMCVCVCVIWPSCTTSWLIVPRSGPVIMRATQYQTKEMASPGDSSSLAEPVTAPSTHGRPLTDARPPTAPLPSTLFTAACFSNLHAGQNTRLLLHAKPDQRSSETRVLETETAEQRVNDREEEKRESGHS